MNDNDIFYKLLELENKISKLEEKIDKLLKTCGNMDDHISFVETIYETLNSPINFISNNIRYLT
jgi:hypothetical protein